MIIGSILHSTPAYIVPEWYFLPFYAILRVIPNNVGGILATGGAVVMLSLYPLLNTSILSGNVFPEDLAKAGGCRVPGQYFSSPQDFPVVVVKYGFVQFTVAGLRWKMPPSRFISAWVAKSRALRRAALLTPRSFDPPFPPGIGNATGRQDLRHRLARDGRNRGGSLCRYGSTTIVAELV